MCASFAWVWLGLLFIVHAHASPDLPTIYSHFSSSNDLPKPVKYFKQNGDRLTTEGVSVSSGSIDGVETAAAAGQQPEPRLGYPLYSATSFNQGGSTVPGMYSPVKLDLGGLLLGTVVGLGAVLLIPKIVHIFSATEHSSYGHYARDEGGMTSGVSGVTEVMSRIEKAISEQHLNTTSCVQRALCSVWQWQAAPSPALPHISTIPVVSDLLEGSRLQEAVTAGRTGQSCASLYSQCPLSLEILANGLNSIFQ